MMKTFIARIKYLEKIAPYRDTNLIKVLVGQRRVGEELYLTPDY